jgi:signal transduction histidine kinase
MKVQDEKSVSERESRNLHLARDSQISCNVNNASLRRLTHDLTERVKELNCLYGISRLIETTNSLEEILQGAVEFICASWQYPEITCARIKLRKRQFQTTNFVETEWQQVENIVVKGNPFGKLEVCYLEERPQLDEGPFLSEERHLIHAVAEQLGKVIERKHAEDKLESLYHKERQLRESLQREMQNRVDFTKKLIHELKTPLTSLLATSQLLHDETLGMKVGKLAGYVWDSARSLDNRVNELHDLVRGEFGMLELKSKPLHLQNLLSSIVEETRALANQSNVVVNLELEPPLPRVYADASRVRQIMLNLLNNAFKYASSGGMITVKATSNESSVTVEVRDQGPGIALHEQKRLFEPYYSSVYKGKHTRGLGIGLALCKVLVELHGGKIWVKSCPGKGASFFFTLPTRAKKGKD